MAIDSKISPDAINKSERAIIEKFGFDVKDANGRFEVQDPILKKVRGSTWKNQGGNLSILLTAALSARQTYEKSIAAAPAPAPAKKNGGKKKPPVAEQAGTDVTALITGGNVMIDNDEAGKLLNETAPETAEKKPEAEGAPEAEVQAETVQEIATNGEEAEAEHAEGGIAGPEDHIEIEQEEDAEIEGTGGRQRLDEDEVPADALHGGPGRAPDEIEVDEVDETGKRKRKSRKNTEPKVKKPSRYEKAAVILLKEALEGRAMTAEKLATAAGFSKGTSDYVLEAWNGICKVLAKEGHLKGKLADLGKDKNEAK